MFKFNFNNTDDSSDSYQDSDDEAQTNSPIAKKAKFDVADKTSSHEVDKKIENLNKPAEAHEIHAEQFTKVLCRKEIISSQPTKFLKLSDTQLLYFIDSTSVEEKLKSDESSNESALANVLRKNTDISPNVYEGGLKIWECSIDLTEYLHKEDIQWPSMHVFELGCGAGLPGLYALSCGADVQFQDYNIDVIENVTIPNMVLNSVDKEGHKGNECNARFFAGDWSNVDKLLCSKECKPFDVILASETIYSKNTYEAQLSFIKHHLKKPNGVVYIAAKIFYFGVGGGIEEFIDFVKNDKNFTVNQCWQNDSGLERQILKIVWNDHGILCDVKG